VRVRVCDDFLELFILPPCLEEYNSGDIHDAICARQNPPLLSFFAVSLSKTLFFNSIQLPLIELNIFINEVGINFSKGSV
jgi:hypothetical protein